MTWLDLNSIHKLFFSIYLNVNVLGVPAACFNCTGHDNKYQCPSFMNRLGFGRQQDWQLSLNKPNYGAPSRVSQACVVRYQFSVGYLVVSF